MSNLIPEKRMDKNGRLVTKHVRATINTGIGTATVPAPAIPAARQASSKLIAGQMEERPRTFDFDPFDDETVSRELLSIVRPKDIRGQSHFTASDEQIYSVLSMADDANALLLLEASVRSAGAAQQYLEEHGLAHVIADHAAMSEDALSRRIPPECFVEAKQVLGEPSYSDHYMDAVETHSLTFLGKLNVHYDVHAGNIKLPDLKKIGAVRLKYWRAVEPVKSALREINDSDAAFTIDHITELMDRYKDQKQYMFPLTLNIAREYGIDFAMSLKSPDWGYAEFMLDTGVETERAKVLLKYSDEIEAHRSENAIYREPLNYTKLARYYDAGLSVVDAADCDLTDQQIDGISKGVQSSISGGWL